MVESAARFLDGLPWLAVAVTFVFAAFPVALVHELGHAVVALWRVDGPVIVIVGRDRGKTTCTIGRVAFKLDPFRGFRRITERGQPTGLCTHRPSPDRVGSIAIALGGPVASLLFGGLAALVARSASSYSIEVAFVMLATFSIVAGIDNLVPRTHTYRGGLKLRSDGGSILDELRDRPAPALVQPIPQRLWIHPTPRPATDGPESGGGADPTSTVGGPLRPPRRVG